MSKSILAFVLFALVAPLSTSGATAGSAAPSAASVAAEWIYLGRDIDPETGEIVHVWEWSEYLLVVTTNTKTPPPPPIDRQGIGQS